MFDFVQGTLVATNLILRLAFLGVAGIPMYPYMLNRFDHYHSGAYFWFGPSTSLHAILWSHS